MAFFEKLDESISKLLSAQGLLQFGEQWLHKAYLILKDDQALYDHWCSCLAKCLEKYTMPSEQGQGPADEDTKMRQILENSLRGAVGRELANEADETAFRSDETLCVVREIQLAWIKRQRNVTAPRRLSQLQATQVASCSFRGKLKAGQALNARKKAAAKAGSSGDAPEADDEDIQDTAGAPGEMTAARVKKATLPELKSLAAMAGPMPSGRSRFKKPDWLKHVLEVFGFAHASAAPAEAP